MCLEELLAVDWGKGKIEGHVRGQKKGMEIKIFIKVHGMKMDTNKARSELGWDSEDLEC